MQSCYWRVRGVSATAVLAGLVVGLAAATARGEPTIDVSARTPCPNVAAQSYAEAGLRWGRPELDLSREFREFAPLGRRASSCADSDSIVPPISRGNRAARMAQFGSRSRPGDREVVSSFPPAGAKSE